MRNGIYLFLLGLVLGIVAGVLVPRWATPHLPAALRSQETVTEGVVVAKERRDGQLLLTVDTDEGAVLATFHEKVDEISLLVNEGDTVGLGLQGYEPFAEDPPIRRVVKERPSPEAVTPPPVGGVPPEPTGETPAAGTEAEPVPQADEGREAEPDAPPTPR